MTDLRRSASGAGDYGAHGRKLSVTMSINSEDDAQPASRPTRSRVGPLPPNGPTNPLFPPLPPKIPRPPRDKSDRSRSNSAQNGGGTPSKKRSGMKVEGDADGEGPGEAARENGDDEAVKMEVDEDEPSGEPSTADIVAAQVLLEAENPLTTAPLPTTLVDPAPDSASARPATDSALDDKDTEHDEEEGGDEWDSYRKRHLHHIKPFGAAPPRSGDEVKRAESSETGGVLSESTGEGENEKPAFDPLDCVLPSKAFLADPTNTIIPLSTSSSSSSSASRPAVGGTATAPASGGKPASGGASRSKKAAPVAPRGGARGKGLEDGGERDKDVTRCVCEKDDIDVMMIQCDYCEVWQHGACVGVWGDEEAPDEYYCDVCRPGLHAPLKRLFKLRAKRGQGFTPPTSWDLMHHHYPSDRIKPSQSKRWIDPSIIKVHFEAPANSKSGSDAGGKDKPKRSHHRKPIPGGGEEVGKDGAVREGSAQPSGSVSSREGKASKPNGDIKDPLDPSVSTSASGSGSRPPNSGGAGSKRKLSIPSHRRASTTPSDTASEHPVAPPTRKRNTMNSRDAAYDNAIAASLLEAGLGGPVKELLADEKRRRKGEELKERERERREEGGLEDEDEGDDVDMDEAADDGDRGRSARKRRRDEESEGEEELGDDDERGLPAKRARKKKDDGNGDLSIEKDAHGKIKHPNQYTYRPKGASSQPVSNNITVSQAKQVVTSPIKKAAVPKEIVEKAEQISKRHVLIREPRASTPSSSRPDSGVSANGLGNLSWGLPDHLAPFAHLLPSPIPLPLELVTPRPINSKVAMKDVNLSQTQQTHFEAPTKVRYPAKRVTVGEMRKRVRSVSEYVAGIQMEEAKRAERAKLLGLQAPPKPEEDKADVVVKEVKDIESNTPGETSQEITVVVTTADAGDIPALATSSSSGSATSSTSDLPRSMQLMNDLMKDLIQFQELFEPGGIGSYLSSLVPSQPNGETAAEIGGAMEVDG